MQAAVEEVAVVVVEVVVVVVGSFVAEEVAGSVVVVEVVAAGNSAEVVAAGSSAEAEEVADSFAEVVVVAGRLVEEVVADTLVEEVVLDTPVVQEGLGSRRKLAVDRSHTEAGHTVVDHIVELELELEQHRIHHTEIHRRLRLLGIAQTQVHSHQWKRVVGTQMGKRYCIHRRKT